MGFLDLFTGVKNSFCKKKQNETVLKTIKMFRIRSVKDMYLYRAYQVEYNRERKKNDYIHICECLSDNELVYGTVYTSKEFKASVRTGNWENHKFIGCRSVIFPDRFKIATA
jgi:hypothetical protein